MYASFLLKYSKSYLHTCIIFYMFILFFFSFNATRADVSYPSRVLGYTPIPPPTLLTRFCFSKRFVTLAPFSPSFSLSIGDFYLSLVLLGTDHRWWTQWGTPARPGSEKGKKMKKKEEEKGCLANLWELTRPASSVYVCTRTYVGYACSFRCVCVCVCV